MQARHCTFAQHLFYEKPKAPPDAGPDRYLYGFDASVVLSPNVTGGTPEYAYVWTDQGTIINKDGAENVSVSSPGTYVINVTDENGCFGTDSVNLIEVVPDIMVTHGSSVKARIAKWQRSR